MKSKELKMVYRGSMCQFSAQVFKFMTENLKDVLIVLKSTSNHVFGAKVLIDKTQGRVEYLWEKVGNDYKRFLPLEIQEFEHSGKAFINSDALKVLDKCNNSA